MNNKKLLLDGFAAACNSATDSIDTVLEELYDDEAELFAFHPVNEVVGRENIKRQFWQPLRNALPDLERRDLLVAGGDYKGAPFVAMMGHYQGTFVLDLFDIPATHGTVHIRYGEIHEIGAGRVVRSHVIVDTLDLMRQARCWPIAPSVGAEVMWPGPARQNGLRLDYGDDDVSRQALSVVKEMHAALFNFDGHDIESMVHGHCWTENFMWYGPSGIGTTRGMHGFRAHHQIPFLRAFPDRRIGKHIANIADGGFVVTGGWPSVIATHSGPDWLGLPGTGKPVKMRVMDFYSVVDGLIAENWVPIDIVDIVRQLGVDVFDRIRHIRGNPRLTL